MIARRAAALLAYALLAFGLAAPAHAHKLNVFAAVEGAEVAVEAKFSNGKRPVRGVVMVKGDGDAPLLTMPLGPDGAARFALDSVDHASGLTIEVETGEAHRDYWILTPEDIARGRGE
ncbi:MAG: hypothetical protein AAGM38_06120 [Pseudomonadota bacterium]